MRITQTRIAAITAVAAIACAGLAPANATGPPSGLPTDGPRPSDQITTPLVATFPTTPQPATPGGFDWRQRALDYDSFVYDWDATGEGHPTILLDETHLNMDSNTYKIPVYYADTRFEVDGYQEAINQIASVVGATLVGVDKSAQDGFDYVSMLRTFFHDDLGIAMNNPFDRTGGGADTFWYTTTSNVLYYMLGSQYPDSPEMAQSLRSIADSHYDMVVALGGADVDFTGQGFSFETMTINPGNRNEGGDAAAGTAAILLWAWEQFGDARYLEGAQWSMDFLDRSPTGLYYEILPVLAPYVAARLNAEAGTSYDPSRYVRWLESGSSARPGWGTVADAWNGFDVAGLMGSQTDGGGYAFAMNSFSVALMAPTAKYDARYASLVGAWLQNVDNAARFFYPDQMSAAQQSHGDRFINTPESVIPYEGLRAQENGFAPRATGDPSRYGADWGLDPQTTDLGLYGGSWVGFLGGVISHTNVEGVIRADLDATDFHADTGYPTSLLYNSTDADAPVAVTLAAPALLFDAVSDTVLADTAAGTTTVLVPAHSSVVLVEAAVGGTLERTATATLIDGIPVAYVATTPPEAAPPVNVALGADITWSSDQNGNLGSNLVDGTTGTRWESLTADPQWFEIDLGASYDLDRFVVNWEFASAKVYTIEVSLDGEAWSTAHATTAGPGGVENLIIPVTPARFIRFTGTERNTRYAYSAYEFEAYGTLSDVTPTDPTPKETSDPSDPGSTELTTPPTGTGGGRAGTGVAEAGSESGDSGAALAETGGSVAPLGLTAVLVLLLGTSAIAATRRLRQH